MDPIVFLKGLAIGYAMAVPPGPAAMLCMRKTLANGRLSGMSIGFGAATADMVLASIAAFGLTFISDAIAREQFWLRMGGGALLLVLGIRLTRIGYKDPIVPLLEKSWFGSYSSAIFLGVTNPMTIFSFLAVFSLFNLARVLDLVNGWLLVSGVFAGSSLWSLSLSQISLSFRKHLASGGFVWVNRLAAFLIIACGVAAFVSVM